MQCYRDFLMLRMRLRGGSPGRKLGAAATFMGQRPSADSGGTGAADSGAYLTSTEP